jgi:hypothetical protein
MPGPDQILPYDKQGNVLVNDTQSPNDVLNAPSSLDPAQTFFNLTGNVGSFGGQILGLEDAGTLSIQVSGTFSATAQVQVTVDGFNWLNVTGSNTIINAVTGTYATPGNITAAGIYQMDVSGFNGVRMILTVWASGTMNVALRVSDAIGLVSLEGATSVVVSSDTPATPTVQSLTAAASTNATSTKTTAGTVYSIALSNYAAYATYFKLYNKASAPTVGTDIPLQTIAVAANSYLAVNMGALGLRFSTGIAFAMTKLQADTDTTVLVAGDLKDHMSYI